MDISLFLKILSIGLFVVWQLYWFLTQIKAEKEKPSSKTPQRTIIRKNFAIVYGIFLILQLLGLEIFPMHTGIVMQSIGLLIQVIAICVAVSARITLAANWSHAADYQIKKNHELITSGIYNYIRHPIYAGLLVSFSAAQLIFDSYLFIPVFLVMTYLFYLQAKKEEKILIGHFGQKYTNYMKTTKMFFPWVF